MFKVRGHKLTTLLFGAISLPFYEYFGLKLMG